MIVELQRIDVNRRHRNTRGRDLPQYHFVHQNSHMDWPGDWTLLSAVRSRGLTPYITQAFNMHLYFLGVLYTLFLFCVCACHVSQTDISILGHTEPRSKQHSCWRPLHGPFAGHNILPELCVVYTIHKLKKLQVASRELQRIGYIGLWRISLYVWENTPFPLEGPFCKCCKGNDHCSFQESRCFCWLRRCICKLRGLKGLTKIEMDSSEMFLALQFWLNSRDNN